jgi:CRP-like cAMP-binding protein
MTNCRELRALADERLFAGDYPAALHRYAALVALQAHDLDARLRVADTLLSLGEAQRAAVVYTTLARHAANGGYPLRALVALKVLTQLEPQLAALLAPVAQLYALGSPRLGRAVRISPGDPEQLLPPTLSFAEAPPLPDLIAYSERIASNLDPIGAYPEFLPAIPLFSELPADAFAALLGALSLVRRRPGETIIAEGEPGHSFFMLARGTVRVTRKDMSGSVIQLATLHDGSIFGEMALVSATPRTATVTAETDCDFLEFDREALSSVARDAATIARALDKFTRERLLNNLLATSALFKPLDRKQRLDLVRRFTAHDVAQGVEVIREGQPGRGIFVLLAGELDVSKIDGADRVLLATLHPGDVFGEISLLNDGPTTASVTAARASTVLFLSREIFQRLLEAVPDIRAYIESLSEERMMDTRIVLESSREDEIAVDLDEDDLILI